MACSVASPVMARRSDDGSAGDVDYGEIGTAYSRYRRPDPRIAQRVTAALGTAQTVLNVGAGAGSYEPTDREVTAVEPSASMRAQQPSSRKAGCLLRPSGRVAGLVGVRARPGELAALDNEVLVTNWPVLKPTFEDLASACRVTCLR